MIPFTIKKLDELLSSQVISGVLIAGTFLIFFLNFSLVLQTMSAVIILFSIYMPIVLYRHQKFGWFYSFLGIMILSFGLSYFTDIGTVSWAITNYLPLFSFFIYCAILKIQIREWVMEMDYERDQRFQNAIEQNRKNQ